MRVYNGFWGIRQSMGSIKQDIITAHSRIAGSYGIIKLDGIITQPSYDHWNYMRFMYAPLLHFTARCFQGSGFSVLDAGCGNGQFSQIYAQLGASAIYGLDMSEAMLKAAQSRAQSLGFNDRFKPILGDLEEAAKLDIPQVDMVHFFGVIEHLDDPAAVLSNLASVMKPSGYMLLAYPRKYSLSFFTYLLFGQSPKHWGEPVRLKHYLSFSEKLQYYRFFTPRGIETKIDSSGLRLLQRYPIAFINIVGPMRKLLTRLAGKYERGYRMLDRMENLARICYRIPAGEYLLLRKKES